MKQDSDAQTLANPRIRIMSNRKASFMVGDKIPIQTSTIESTATAAVTSTFEYKDVGIKLNIEPIVHLDNTVTLNLKVEVSTLGNLLSFGMDSSNMSLVTGARIRLSTSATANSDHRRSDSRR